MYQLWMKLLLMMMMIQMMVLIMIMMMILMMIMMTKPYDYADDTDDDNDHKNDSYTAARCYLLPVTCYPLPVYGFLHKTNSFKTLSEETLAYAFGCTCVRFPSLSPCTCLGKNFSPLYSCVINSDLGQACTCKEGSTII